MEVTTEIVWNKKVQKGLEILPDSILYAVAKQTLDFSIPIIPMSDMVNHAGTLRRSSSSAGVRKGANGYFVGSFTNYASYVWTLDDNTTNWTTPGTHSQWYARTLKEKGKVIIDNAINQSWKDNM